MDNTKTCTKCGRVLGLDEFYNNKSGVHGKHSRCKQCMIEISAEYETGHRRKINERNRNRMANDVVYAERRRRVCREWQKKNPDIMRACSKRSYGQNVERNRAEPKDEITMKVCSKCHKRLPRSEFHNSYGMPDGKNYWCKKCASQYEKMRRNKA